MRYTHGSRLIIDSGSNSVYGINSIMLEKELSILTINLADNGSYPLREKLYRLERFAHKGDIILMPLEWSYYLADKRTEIVFLENLFDKLNFYYNEMSFAVKINLIVETPFSSLLKQSITGNSSDNGKYKARNEYIRLLNYKNAFNNGIRGDYKHIEKKPVMSDWIKKLTCDDAVLGSNLAFSNVFKKNIILINQMQKKGIHVLFTWPVVVGDDCYQNKDLIKLKLFAKEIKNYLNQHNLFIVAEPEDSLFKSKYMLDSYYHIIAEARDMRTRRLIETIKKSVAMTWLNKEQQPQYSLSINESLLKAKFIDSIKTTRNKEKLLFNTSDSIFLVSGWYSMEQWGVWSKGVESILYIKLASDLIQCNLQLMIENNLYRTQDKTTVLINDKKLGDYLLAGKNSLTIPKQFLNDNGGLVKIQFNHHYVKSPLEYGENRDPRKLKFGLKSLQLNKVTH